MKASIGSNRTLYRMAGLYLIAYVYKIVIPVPEKEHVVHTLGQNTLECMTSGALQGLKFEAEGFIRYFKELSNPLFFVFITGGDADFLADQLKSSIFAPLIRYEPDLVNTGLNYILRYQLQQI